MAGLHAVSELEDNIRSMSLEGREAREFDEDKGTMMCSFEDLPLVFSCQKHRHENTSIDLIMQTWRMREREIMITVSVALFTCLNVEVDLPDVTKTQPYARQ